MNHERSKTREHEREKYGFGLFRDCRVLRVVVASWLLVAAMSAQTPPQPRTVEKGDQSNIENAKQVLVRTDAELRTLWQQHSPDRPPPKIDFAKEMIVAVFMGSRPNAGFSTAVVSATAAAGVLMVRYSETKPGPGTVAAQILTFPYDIVAIPKADVRDVRFEKAP